MHSLRNRLAQHVPIACYARHMRGTSALSAIQRNSDVSRGSSPSTSTLPGHARGMAFVADPNMHLNHLNHVYEVRRFVWIHLFCFLVISNPVDYFTGSDSRH